MTAQRFRNLFPSRAAAVIFERAVLGVDDELLPEFARKVRDGEDPRGSKAYWAWLIAEATAPDDSVTNALRDVDPESSRVPIDEVEDEDDSEADEGDGEIRDRRAYLLGVMSEIEDADAFDAWAEAAGMDAGDLRVYLSEVEGGKVPTASRLAELRAAAIEVLRS